MVDDVHETALHEDPPEMAYYDAFRAGDVWLARSRRYGDIRKALRSAPAVADADRARKRSRSSHSAPMLPFTRPSAHGVRSAP